MRIVAGLLMLFWMAGSMAGCKNKDKEPSGIIPRAEMTTILWDIIQADQYADLYLARDSARIRDSVRINVKMETLKLYQQVFTMHHISREEFNKSFLYYQERPDLTRGMFDSLVARGNRLRTENYSRPPATPVITNPGLTPAAAGGRTLPATTKLPPAIVPRPGMTPRPGISPRPGVTIPGQPGGNFHRPVPSPGYHPPLSPPGHPAGTPFQLPAGHTTPSKPPAKLSSQTPAKSSGKSPGKMRTPAARDSFRTQRAPPR